MATTKEDIKNWIDSAPKGTTHMVVVCDTFDYEDYPVYVSKKDNVHEVVGKYSGANTHMQKVMEVYNLKKSIKEQLASTQRVFNY
jgi:hypothetical protein